MLGLKTISQEVDYETQLAKYMSEFKNNLFSEAIRTELVDKVYSLKDQIEIQIKLNNSDNSENRILLSTDKRISSFYNYLRCFTDNRENISYEEFMYVNNILGIYPIEIPGLSCNLAKLYEIKIGKFKAILIQNLLIPKEHFEYKTIKVDYDYDFNGRVISGSSMNVGGGKVRCAMYLSDTKTNYHTIVSIRCSEVKSSFSN
jgi:hypothetical protein